MERKLKVMNPVQVLLLTLLAVFAFAGNSILCRLALKSTEIDAATFTSIRLISGGVILWLLVRRKKISGKSKGDPISALALFVYAASFSFAYLGLSSSMGALILFGVVQVTMISYGRWTGERLSKFQLAGVLVALGGLIGLLLPGLSAPPLLQSFLMAISGISWGVYSLRGRNIGNPLHVTASNFLLTIPLTILLSLVTFQSISIDVRGVGYAVASGALTSGLGYAIWYKVLPALKATSAAVIQLSVPAIAALGGVLFLDELVTMRLLIATIAILGGVGLVISGKKNT